MLADMITYFKVVDSVAERLGLRLSKEEVEQAKVDRYIVDRLKSALHQLKQCRSAAEQTDYGVGLAMVTPTREAAGNKSGMMSKVFARLGVQGGSRRRLKQLLLW